MMKRNAGLTRKAPLRARAPMARGRSEKRGPGLAQRVAQSLGLAIKHQAAEPSVFRKLQHRMNVAAMPCVCCGRANRSQAAHLNLLALGKGKGLKVSDALLVPLCAAEIGDPGCHYRLDQGAAFDKATAASLQIGWLQATRERLMVGGQWPAEAEADLVRIVGAYLERQG